MKLQRSRLFALATSVFFLGLAGGAARDPAAAADPEVRRLYDAARERYGRVDSYIARLTRREKVRGEQRPEELILFKFRAEPWSAYLRWLGEAGEGREGLYVPGRHDDKVHTRIAAGDVPLFPAGYRMSLAPDGALLKAASPHPITALGLGAALDKLGDALAAQERGDDRLGTLAAVGPEKLEEFDEPVRGIEHRLPPGADPAVPRGGRRVYWFDPATGLPTVARTRDDTGTVVEYYRYDRLQLGVGLDDADFDPDRLWGARPGKVTTP